MAIIAIVAVDKNLAIGKDGGIPWHYSDDLKFFKRTTIGNACVMGARTWASIGKPLPGRLNIVLSRALKPEQAPGAVVLPDVTSVLALYVYLKCDLYVIGGARVYSAFRGAINRWIVTKVPMDAEGADTFMEPDFLDGFHEEENQTFGDVLVVTTYVSDRLISVSSES